MLSSNTAKKKLRETVKQKLLNSFKKNDDEEEPELDEIANSIKEPKEDIKFIKHYEGIKEIQNKRAINDVGKQG